MTSNSEKLEAGVEPVEAPAVSIVIPAYNAAKYLAQTLESVRAQTFSNWECIVVDDGSSDTTAQIAEEFAAHDKRIRWVSQTNAGVSAARNNGWARAHPRSLWVAFLDADDLWEPEFLQTLSAVLEAHPDAAAAHCTAYYIDQNGHRFAEGVLEDASRRRYELEGGAIVRHSSDRPTTFAMTAVHATIYTPGCALIRRAALEQVGGFNTAFSLGEDWELWVRLSRLSPFPFVNQPLLAYRRHQTNSSSNRKAAVAQSRSLRRAIIESPANTPEQKRVALAAYRAFYWHSAQGRYPATWQHARAGRFKEAAQNLGLALANTAMALRGRP